MKTLLLILCSCLPLKHLSLTSPFGYRIHPITSQYRFHNGIDLRAHHDTVYAVFDGTAFIGYDHFLGIYIKIINGNLTVSYGHLSALFTCAGPVACGEPVALTGATGRVTGEHLHFSIKYKGHYLEPLKFLYQLNLNQYPYE